MKRQSTPDQFMLNFAIAVLLVMTAYSEYHSFHGEALVRMMIVIFLVLFKIYIVVAERLEVTMYREGRRGPELFDPERNYPG